MSAIEMRKLMESVKPLFESSNYRLEFETDDGQAVEATVIYYDGSEETRSEPSSESEVEVYDAVLANGDPYYPTPAEKIRWETWALENPEQYRDDPTARGEWEGDQQRELDQTRRREQAVQDKWTQRYDDDTLDLY